jgi:hypothetical protein
LNIKNNEGFDDETSSVEWNFSIFILEYLI